MTRIVQLEEPRRRAGSQRLEFALWRLGFRPFYLLASVFAALSIGLWALQFSGLLGATYLSGPLWHAHEMLFGFTLAVVVGFLLTAGRNWTNRPTPSGWRLASLVALWLAARVLVLTPYGWAAAITNTAFPVAAAVALAIPFVAARNRRNYFFVGLLLMMAAATLVVHLAQLGVLRLPAWAGIQVALDVVLFIVSVMAGRVVPMFTNHGVRSAAASRHPWVERISLGSVLALLAVDAIGLPGGMLVIVACTAAVAHATRWTLWQPWKTLGTPLVWVLHLAYAWIPLHLMLRVAAFIGWVPPSAATHALTVGAIGGLIIGMMTRTARGHTGRPLVADRSDVVAYALVALAALVRVALPLAKPTWTLPAVVVSAAMWSTAFALYAWRYAPSLLRARSDGLPG